MKTLLNICAVGVMLEVVLASECQGQSYSATRLNNGQPVVTQSMFNAVGVSSEGNNINGPSVIRVPDWIAAEDRVDNSAKYYMYFSHHSGDSIRMAWAADLEGPWNLFNIGTSSNSTVAGAVTPGNGVLDLNLGGTNDKLPIPRATVGGTFDTVFDHIASPDVRVDHENHRIAMYFHGPSENTTIGQIQKTYVATSSNGLNFNLTSEGGEPGHGPRDIMLGEFYFRTFSIAGREFAYSNKAELYAAPVTTGGGKLATLANADDEGGIWNRPGSPNPSTEYWTQMATSANPIENLYENFLGEGGDDPRHFAVYHNRDRDPDHIYVAYSARFDRPESILLSVIVLAGLSDSQRQDPSNWTLMDVDPYTQGNQYQKVLLLPQQIWEGVNLPLSTSQNGSKTGVRQLRDPYIFEDQDGATYLFYTGRGEEAIGIASVVLHPKRDFPEVSELPPSE